MRIGRFGESCALAMHGAASNAIIATRPAIGLRHAAVRGLRVWRRAARRVTQCRMSFFPSEKANGVTHSFINQSARMLASLMSFAHIADSVRLISAYCSGVVPVGA